MPNTTILINKEGVTNENKKQRFKRFYFCHGPLKMGFLDACKHFISDDGWFLKGPYLGQLLIGGNNGIYPFEYDVVNKETKSI